MARAKKGAGYTPTRGALKGQRFATRQAYRNALAKLQGFHNATDKRVKTGVTRGRTVQEARGHRRGDRGKVATRSRGSRYAPSAKHAKATVVEHTSRHALTSNSVEFYSYPYQRNAADEAAFLRRVFRYAEEANKSFSGRLVYRFIYRDIRYFKLEDFEGNDIDDFSSTTFYGYGWTRSTRAEREAYFEKNYHDIKSRSVDGVHYVIFGLPFTA